MTTLLDAIGYYLPIQTANLPAEQQLVLGENLFLGRFPAEAPNAAVLVQLYMGKAPNFTMGSGAIALDNPKIQILVRGEREDYPGAYDLSIVIRNILGSIVGSTVIDGVTIMRLEPLGTPNYTGYDEVDRPKFTQNFQAMLPGS
jgi:hypothetical protein